MRDNLYVLSSVKKIIMALFNIINLILISRILGPELKGKYSTIINYVSIIIVILNFGLTIIYPYIKKNKKECISTLILVIYINFVLISLFSIFLFFLSTNMLFRYIYLLIPFTLLANQLGGITIIEDLKGSVKLYVSSVLFQTLCTLMLLFGFSDSIIGAIIVYIVKDIFIIIFAFKILSSRLKISGFSIKNAKILMSMGIVPMFASLMSSLNYQVDILMLERMQVDFYLIGLYTTGTSLSQIIWMFPDAFKEVIAYKTAREDSINEVAVALRFSVFIAGISILLLVLFGRIGIEILFGRAYSEAIYVTLILFIGNIPMVYFKLIGIYYQVKGRFYFNFIVLCSSVFINLVCNIISIPKYGIYGAAISSVASYSIAGILFVIYFIRETDTRLIEVLVLKRSDIQFIIKKIQFIIKKIQRS